MGSAKQTLMVQPYLLEKGIFCHSRLRLNSAQYHPWKKLSQQMFQAQGLPLVKNEWKQVKKVGVDRIREALQP